MVELLNDLFAEPQRERGKVKWFSEEKGYGFIVPEDGSNDVFFHFSSLKIKGFKTIPSGQMVEFETEETDNGKKATFVRMVLC